MKNWDIQRPQRNVPAYWPSPALLTKISGFAKIMMVFFTAGIAADIPTIVDIKGEQRALMMKPVNHAMAKLVITSASHMDIQIVMICRLLAKIQKGLFLSVIAVIQTIFMVTADPEVLII